MDSNTAHRSLSSGMQPGVLKYQQFAALHELNSCASDQPLLVEKEFGSQQDFDSLLANAGYTVKAADLAHVAQRLEQLESVLGAAQEAGISRLSGEAVHKNPSDLGAWIECMIRELAPCLGPEPRHGPAGAGEFAYGEDYGSCSVDSQLDQRGSFLADVSTQQQASGSISSIDEGPVGGPASTSYGVSGMALLEELGEGFQYKDDEAPSSHMDTFSAGLQAVFPEGMDLPHGTITLQQPTRSYSQQEQLHHPRYHPRNDARPPTLSHGMQPLRGAEMMSAPQMLPQHESGDHFARFSSCGQQLRGGEANGGDLCVQQPMVCNADTVEKEGAQESGILLVRLLMACAEAVQSNDRVAADELVREIRKLAIRQSGAMAKVACHFANALATRIYGANSQDWQAQYGDSWSEFLYFHFYETCPYLKFAHFTANQAILEAFEGRKFVHVIDFNLMQGLQWPALIQALALRPGGPPRLRLTGIGPPQPDDKDVLQEIGMKLAHLADSVNVEFDFRGVVATKLDDVKPWMLQVQTGEAVAVNSILQLHRLLSREGSCSLSAPIDEVLRSVRSLNPRIITVVEQEANHNSPYFLERFMQALQYYCTMFDSLEACNLPPQSSEVALTEIYLGREIVDIVACEGMSRIERHETLSEWRMRMTSAGFRPSHMGSNAFKQASMLLTLFSGEGYTVEENNGCLTLGWHSRPLIAASAWQCG